MPGRSTLSSLPLHSALSISSFLAFAFSNCRQHSRKISFGCICLCRSCSSSQLWLRTAARCCLSWHYNHTPEQAKDDWALQRLYRWELTAKILVFTGMSVYPGLVTRIFAMFRCTMVPGLEDQRWTRDLEEPCLGAGMRTSSFVGTVVAMAVYVAGWPLAVFLSLVQPQDLHNTAPKADKASCTIW